LQNYFQITCTEKVKIAQYIRLIYVECIYAKIGLLNIYSLSEQPVMLHCFTFRQTICTDNVAGCAIFKCTNTREAL